MINFLALPALLLLIVLNRPPIEHSVLFLILAFLELLNKKRNRIKVVRFFIFLSISVANIFLENSVLSFFYPVFMNGLVSYFFIESFFKDETLIEKFAKKHERNFTPAIKKYCFKLNLYWSILMATLTLISLYTALSMNKETWLLWNGFISYVIIGTSLVGEFFFRKFHKNRIAPSSILLLLFCIFSVHISQAQTCPPKPKDKKLIFTELRYIPHISEPVKVTGYLDIKDSENYTWETDGDYAAKIEQTSSGTTFYKKESGAWVKTETNQFLDIFLEINSAINGGTKKEGGKLKSECKIEKDGSWVLSLAPLDDELEIDSIKIEGKDNPQKFSMEMKNGFKSFVSYH